MRDSHLSGAENVLCPIAETLYCGFLQAVISKLFSAASNHWTTIWMVEHIESSHHGDILAVEVSFTETVKLNLTFHLPCQKLVGASSLNFYSQFTNQLKRTK